MDIGTIKRLYNAILEGVRKPTKKEAMIRAPYCESYKHFWYYFKSLKKVIVKWELCGIRLKSKLSNARWKITGPTERALCPLIPDFWINAVAKLCDLIGTEMGLIFDERTYEYKKPVVPKKARSCKITEPIKPEEKFKISTYGRRSRNLSNRSQMY